MEDGDGGAACADINDGAAKVFFVFDEAGEGGGVAVDAERRDI